MVATRGSDGAVAFVLGKARLDSKTIRVEEWVQIIRTVVDEVPTNYMRGFKSIQQNIIRESPFEVERRLEGPLPSLSRAWRGNEIFLKCAEVGGAFPQGSGFQAWPEAPRDANGELAQIAQGYFLLSRDKKFYYLLVNWLPKEEFSEDSPHSSRADNLWYEVEKQSMELMELDDLKFHNVLAANEDRKVAYLILRSIYLSLRASVDDLRGQYDQMFEKKERVGRYLDRIA